MDFLKFNLLSDAYFGFVFLVDHLSVVNLLPFHFLDLLFNLLLLLQNKLSIECILLFAKFKVIIDGVDVAPDNVLCVSSVLLDCLLHLDSILLVLQLVFFNALHGNWFLETPQLF